jgi:hypothetical protein
MIFSKQEIKLYKRIEVVGKKGRSLGLFIVSLCLMCVGLMLVPVILPVLFNKSEANYTVILIPIGIIFVSVGMIGYNHKKTVKKYKDAAILDKEGNEFIRRRRKQGDKLFIISMISLFIIGLGLSFIPELFEKSPQMDGITYSLILLLLFSTIISIIFGIFTFIGYLFIASSKLNKWKEYYDKTLSGIQVKVHYINTMEDRLQKRKNKTPFYFNQRFLVGIFIIFFLTLLFITIRNTNFFLEGNYPPYLFIITIVLILGLFFALMTLTYIIFSKRY